MRISEMQLTKRQLLGGVAAATASIAVYGTAQAAPEIPQPDGDVDMAKVMTPGALPEMALGKTDAPVKIVEYMSMTCPHCAHFHNTTFDAIKQKYVDTGKVEFVLREFPFDPRAAAAFMLARCNPQKPEELATPEQYFPMVAMLFKQQQVWAAADDGRAALLQVQARRIY
jgi:protein-disulfide isomerase